MTKFGERLRELRNDKKMSQQQIAELLFVSQASIADWERGITETDFTNLTKLAKFFGVTTDFLLGLKDY